MFQECRHILTSGHKCKAAALRGQAYCYYHTASRRYARKKITQMDPLEFPSIEDAAGVQIAINQVLRGLGSWRIEPRHAGVYFYGLQIAARLARKSGGKPSETVREISEKSQSEQGSATFGSDSASCGETNACAPGESALGDQLQLGEDSAPAEELGPEKTICEPPLDCLYCDRCDFCPDWNVHENDAIELLDRIRAEEKARKKNPDLETCTPKVFDE